MPCQSSKNLRLISCFFKITHFRIEKLASFVHCYGTMKSGNLLILQSGISNVTSNAVLYGMLAEALNFEIIEEIYGACNGFEGLAAGQLIDLAALSQKKAQLLLSSAGNALHSESGAFKATTHAFEQMVRVLSQKGIRYVGVICDQEALAYVQNLIEAARQADYELHVIAIPLSNYNELPMTDHSLGYGSCVKYVNAYLRSFDAWLEDNRVQVGVCEIVGGNNGWLVASAALNYTVANGKLGSNEESLPYIVCLPEQPFNEDIFLDLVKVKVEKFGYVRVITHSQLVDEEGNVIDFSDYGSTGAYLENLIDSLDYSVQFNLCDLQLQPLSQFMSKKDVDEAVLCGRKSLQQMLEEGESDQAAVLVRKEGEREAIYEVRFVKIEEIASGLKFFPTDWIAEATSTIQYALIKYALPLIQGEVAVAYEKGLPQFAQF